MLGAKTVRMVHFRTVGGDLLWAEKATDERLFKERQTFKEGRRSFRVERTLQVDVVLHVYLTVDELPERHSTLMLLYGASNYRELVDALDRRIQVLTHGFKNKRPTIGD